VIALLSTVLALPDDERTAVERALVPFARRAAAGALAADIAHDAGNSLFGLVGLLGLIVDDEPVGADRRRLLTQSAAELDRALTPLLRFLHTPDDEDGAGDLAAATEEAVSLYRHGRRKHLAVDIVSGPLAVACPPSLLTQAVVHLLLAADPVEQVELVDGALRVSPAREQSLDEVVAARIAADHGGSVERQDDALVLRLPSG
jgi:signal transduction histidine kinase